MKHRLQTFLRHKLQWLVLLTALLGVSQGMWGTTYNVAGNGSGTWCNGQSWDTNGAVMSGSGTPESPATITFNNVSQSCDLQFKITQKGSWDNAIGWSNNVSLTNSQGAIIGDAGGNIKLQITQDANITITYDGTNVSISTSISSEKYYYRGCDNSWGTTDLTDESGIYGYYYTNKSCLNDNGQFKISRTKCTYDYGYSKVDNSKITVDNITLSGSDDNNITIASAGYIIVYYPNTSENDTDYPIICAASNLPTVCNTPTVSFSTAPSSVCPGATGVSYTASGSTTTGTIDSYTWTVSGTGWSRADSGTEATATFNASTTNSGTIYVTATNSCGKTSSQASTTTSLYANPSTPTIKSYTASVCSSGTPTFTVASSTGLTYQMYTGGSTSGSSVAGEDSKDKTLTAAAITSAASYVMRATNGNGCYAESDAASVTITPDMALTSITLTPSNICVGGTSVASETGLELGGGSIEYTASPAAKVSIDDREITGVAVADGITITATVSGGCGSAPDPKTATLNVKAAPTAYTLSASGESEAYICSAGGTLTLSGSQSGYSYQLKKDGSNYGDAKAGTGSALVFTVYESGDYTCEAYLTGSPDCKTSMTGTVTLHLSLTPNLLPATPTVRNFEPVVITSINTDIETWTITNGGEAVTDRTAYLYNITSNTATVKALKAASSYTVTATTSGGCSNTVTVTAVDYAETCN